MVNKVLLHLKVERQSKEKIKEHLMRPHTRERGEVLANAKSHGQHLMSWVGIISHNDHCFTDALSKLKEQQKKMMGKQKLRMKV